jgi:thiol-disulfide isomerase/thioredoxin
MKYIIGLVGMLLPLLSGAQSPPVKPLTIGDTVPDITLTNVYNYPSSTIRLSDLKGKLVILDFWATWCSSCIREFPRLDSLQGRFKDKIQVILISSRGSNSLKEITQFFKSHPDPFSQKYTFPYAVNDTTLTKRFSHISLPHLVWIYNGKVTAITDGEDVSAFNIQSVLQHKPLSMEMKEDVISFNPGSPLLQQANNIESVLIRESVFTRYLKGMTSRTGLSLNADSTLQRFYVINQPILKLYAIALPGIDANRLIIENADTEALIYSGDDKAWEKVNFYSYEITLPAGASLAQIRKVMLEDINRQFSLKSSIEDRTVECYAIIISDSVLFNKAKRNSAENPDHEKAAVWPTQNKLVSQLCKLLNDQVPGDPLRPVVLNETNVTEPVSLELKIKDLHDLAAVKTALHPYGLDLVKVERTIPMLILSGVDTAKEHPVYSQSN